MGACDSRVAGTRWRRAARRASSTRRQRACGRPQSARGARLVDHVLQLRLGRVLAQRAHDGAQLLGRDGACAAARGSVRASAVAQSVSGGLRLPAAKRVDGSFADRLFARRCCAPLLRAASARRCCAPLLRAAVARRFCAPRLRAAVHVPSPSLSKSANASLNSAICSSASSQRVSWRAFKARDPAGNGENRGGRALLGFNALPHSSTSLRPPRRTHPSAGRPLLLLCVCNGLGASEGGPASTGNGYFGVVPFANGTTAFRALSRAVRLKFGLLRLLACGRPLQFTARGLKPSRLRGSECSAPWRSSSCAPRWPMTKQDRRVAPSTRSGCVCSPPGPAESGRQAHSPVDTWWRMFGASGWRSWPRRLYCKL